MEVAAQWYLPTRFMRDLVAAVAREPAPITTLHPWPDHARWALVLTHDVESPVGLKNALRLVEIEAEFGFRSAWNVIPYLYPVDGAVLQELRDRGCEVGVHGYNHDGRLFESPGTFSRRATFVNDALDRWQATGFRAPMVHRNLQWLQQLNVDYDASCFDIDPYQAMPGGVGGIWPFIAGKFVELPYTLPQDHTLLIARGEADDHILRQKLEFITRYHGMALWVTHPDYLLGDRELEFYRRFLAHLLATYCFWHALPSEVSGWWRERDATSLVNMEDDKYCLAGPATARAALAEWSAAGDELEIHWRAAPVSTVSPGLSS